MGPYGFETNDYCIFSCEIDKERQFVDVFIKDEEGGKNMNYVQEENETTESHMHGHAHLGEGNDFQPIVKAKNKEYLAYDDGQ